MGSSAHGPCAQSRGNRGTNVPLPRCISHPNGNEPILKVSVLQKTMGELVCSKPPCKGSKSSKPSVTQPSRQQTGFHPRPRAPWGLQPPWRETTPVSKHLHENSKFWPEEGACESLRGLGKGSGDKRSSGCTRGSSRQHRCCHRARGRRQPQHRCSAPPRAASGHR